jgi:DNA invertase Pin-like site-specific DNA recombinase
MRIGYARVSTSEQQLDLQTDALRTAGCERLFSDTVSGAKAERPGLAQALAACRSGDTLVVWKLDRLGRSLPHVVQIVHDLDARGVGFQSLRENIDTVSSGGRLVFHLFAALAEFERDLIREPTNAGLSASAGQRSERRTSERREPGEAESRPCPPEGPHAQHPRDLPDRGDLTQYVL